LSHSICLFEKLGKKIIEIARFLLQLNYQWCRQGSPLSGKPQKIRYSEKELKDIEKVLKIPFLYENVPFCPFRSLRHIIPDYLG
jgi:hypothetical protein